jgi:2-polyprenyl-3-methyl-5-hydroxy-6-metoxy-1,4-benzoquinol methylase
MSTRIFDFLRGDAPRGAKTKRPVIQVPDICIPVAFRRPSEAHQTISAMAREAFGPDVKIGQNVSLSFSGEVIAVPHKTMWYGSHDQMVLQSVDDLVQRMQSYSPEALQKHVGYLDREFMARYLRQTGIRVSQLIDRLAAMGLNPGSRVFEIGALFGSFALPLARLGYRVTAIDRYAAFDGGLDAYVDLMRSEGVELISATRETEREAIAQLPEFDCTIAMAVIEHVPHTPRPFLETMRAKTVPGGIIALDTPNLTRFWNRRRLSQDESIFQDLSLQYECEIPYEGHHREYTAQEMRWLLNRIGCDEISIDMFDYNMLQFDQIDGPHLECLSMILSDLAYADTILACGRRG